MHAPHMHAIMKHHITLGLDNMCMHIHTCIYIVHLHVHAYRYLISFLQERKSFEENVQAVVVF